ncbi:unnamed protein product [Brassica oleracea var. botrytis]
MENLSKAFSLLAFADEDGPSASPPPPSSSTGIFGFRISGVKEYLPLKTISNNLSD